jgi:hypothetical protein
MIHDGDTLSLGATEFTIQTRRDLQVGSFWQTNPSVQQCTIELYIVAVAIHWSHSIHKMLPYEMQH